MSILFKNRITETGRKAIQDLIDHMVGKRKQNISIQSEDFSEVDKYQWLRALIYFQCGDYEKSLALAHSYVSQMEKVSVDDSRQEAYCLLIQSLNLRVLEIAQEVESTGQRYESIRSQIGDTSILITMVEDLFGMATIHQRQAEPKGMQRAFLIGLAILRLVLLVYGKAVPSDVMEHLFELFRSLRFPRDRWEWLLRRCHLLFTDFVGLVSVLIDEGLFPNELADLNNVPKSTPNDRPEKQDYEIVRVMEEPWKSSGFSKDFPMSVAEGELSMRVERLMEEGYRCLRTTGGLSTIVLLFSSHATRPRITILEVDAWSDEKTALFDETFSRTLAENGADSAMAMFMGLDSESERLDEWQGLPLEPLAMQAISVEARDAKSYLWGTQTIRLVAGEYVPEETVVLEAKNGWFSEYQFPVKPVTNTEATE